MKKTPRRKVQLINNVALIFAESQKDTIKNNLWSTLKWDSGLRGSLVCHAVFIRFMYQHWLAEIDVGSRFRRKIRCKSWPNLELPLLQAYVQVCGSEVLKCQRRKQYERGLWCSVSFRGGEFDWESNQWSIWRVWCKNQTLWLWPKRGQSTCDWKWIRRHEGHWHGRTVGVGRHIIHPNIGCVYHGCTKYYPFIWPCGSWLRLSWQTSNSFVTQTLQKRSFSKWSQGPGSDSGLWNCKTWLQRRFNVMHTHVLVASNTLIRERKKCWLTFLRSSYHRCHAIESIRGKRRHVVGTLWF